jgi:hypothetical protein
LTRGLLLIGSRGSRRARLRRWNRIGFETCPRSSYHVCPSKHNHRIQPVTLSRRLGGIVFQMVAITLYTLLAMEFLVRFIQDKPIHPVEPKPLPSPSDSEKGLTAPAQRHQIQGKLRQLVIGLCISTIAVFIRYASLTDHHQKYRINQTASISAPFTARSSFQMAGPAASSIRRPTSVSPAFLPHSNGC